jgi:hypothetical protein
MRNQLAARSDAVPARHPKEKNTIADGECETSHWHNRAMAKPTVNREELEAAIEARKELGAELEPAVIDSFVERIEKSIVKRDEQREKALKRQRDHQRDMVLGAMGISVPLMAIAAIFTGLAGVIAVCVAIGVVAIVSARQA